MKLSRVKQVIKRPLAPGRGGRRREWFSILGSIGILVFIGIAAFGPMLAPYPADARPGEPVHPPSSQHLLGTDDLGHDILSMLLIGARTSLLIGLVAGSLAIVLGIMVGVSAGLAGGRVEATLMRFVDVVLTLPFLPLVIVAAAVFGPALETTIGILAAIMWARPARELRSEVLSIREREYIEASRSMGASLTHIARQYVIPSVLLIAIAQFALAVSIAILLEASLSFLGLGDPTTPSWGTILFYAQQRSAFLSDAWTWWVLPPGIAITLSVLSFIFLTLGIERRMGSDRQNLGTKVPGADITVVQAADHPSVLEVADLTVEYRDTVAVDDVDLSLNRDEILGVVGESGSGKSSLARTLLDLLREPATVPAGRVTVFTEEEYGVAGLAALRSHEISFVPQEAMNALDPRIRLDAQLIEILQTHQDINGTEAQTIAHDTLERVGLPKESHSHYPHELSGGMRQRGVIAISLVNDPEVLVVDEPTTGLDTVTKLNVLDLLEAIQAERGMAVIVISHDLPAVTRVADRIAVMNEGAFVEVGATEQLQSSPTHPYTSELLNARTTLPTRQAGPVSPRDGVSSSGAATLVYEHVSKAYGGEQVLNGVDFSVQRGQSVALLGESGAGKSTLGRMALGLDVPDSGRVRVDGRNVHEWQRQDSRGLGRTVHYVFQDPYSSLPPNQTVGDIVAEPLEIHDEPPGEQLPRVRDALAMVGLTPVDEFRQRYASELSGGERQRVAFARAMILEPTVLVADEPTSMLDAPLQRELLELLYELVDERDTTLLHITHDIAQAGRFADQIAVLHEGAIVEQGPTLSVLQQPAHAQTRTLVDAATALSSTIDTSAQ